MPDVHPSATLGPEVQLADDVRIGPGCILDGPITLGTGTRLLANVMLQGPLTLGQRNLVYPFACLGFAPQHKSFDPDTLGAGLVIGDDNTFREHSTVHRAFTETPTRIGDRNFVMNAGHIGHDAIIANDSLIGAHCGIAGHVEVHDHAIVGPGSGIQQFCRVGRMAFVGGCIGITLDLPPFCIASTRNSISSLNVVALRRHGLRDHIEPLRHAFKLLYRRGHTNKRAVERIEEELSHDTLCMELAGFVKAATHGVIPYHGRRSTEHRTD